MTAMIVLTYTSVLPGFFVFFFINNDKNASSVSLLATHPAMFRFSRFLMVKSKLKLGKVLRKP
jgi:hypothetical protein